MMVSTLCLIALRVQIPNAPAGMRAEFLKTCNAVETDMERGDFESAGKKLQLLPKKSIRVRWDDSNLTGDAKTAFRKVEEDTFAEWMRYMKEVTIMDVRGEPSKKPIRADIEFSFVEKLGQNVESGVPPAVRSTVQDDPSKPRLSCAIALERNKPATPTTANDVHNEVAYSICEYFGMTESPSFGAFSSRTDLTSPFPTRIGDREMFFAQDALRITDALRTAIHAHQKVTPNVPRIQLDKTEITVASVVQGDPKGFSIPIKNTGNGTLNILTRADCFCLTPSPPSSLKSGEASEILVNIDTVHFTGKLHHYFLVYSNDPQSPVKQVDVHLEVTPLYKFISPQGNVFLTGESGVDTDLYLTTLDREKLQPIHTEISSKGSVTLERWSGLLADPDTDEAPVQREGYKIHLHIDPIRVVGRAPGLLTVATNNAAFAVLDYQYYTQIGILLSPASIYFGEIHRAPSSASFFVSRPGSPVKILSVDVDNPFFSVALSPAEKNGDVKGSVNFDGKAPLGQFKANVTLHTDDPKQPILTIPVAGIVR